MHQQEEFVITGTLRVQKYVLSGFVIDTLCRFESVSLSEEQLQYLLLSLS